MNVSERDQKASKYEAYEFGKFRVELATRLLFHDGQVVHLKPKVFDTLLALVSKSGEVVSKDELIQIVWPETAVEENNLTQNISVLRKVLGERPDDHRYIVTIPAVGYRFVADVQVRTATTADVPAQPSEASIGIALPMKKGWITQLAFPRVWIPAVSLLALAVLGIYVWNGGPDANTALSNIPSVAVLPFRSLSVDDSNEYLELGIADVLITKLSHFKQIEVRPTSAIRMYAGVEHNPIAAGRNLNVDSVLQGTIQKAGDQIRVNVQLVDALEGKPLWADTFDEKFTNIFALQDSIADKISSALHLRVTAEERERIYRRYTDNVSAYVAYLRGRSSLFKYQRQETLSAIGFFEDALKLDSQYALAHAGLATASAQMRLRFALNEEIQKWEERAKREANLALSLDSGLAEAHEALAAVYGQTEFDWSRTINESRLALDLNSNRDMPHYYIARAFYHIGLLEHAAEEVQRALDLSPEGRIESQRLRGIIALLSGKFAQAVSIFEESRRLNDATVTWYLAQAYYYEGKRSHAENILAGLGGSTQAEQRGRATLASFLAARGEAANARKLLEQTIANGYRDHHVDYSVGATYAQLGNVAESILWLTRATETGLPCLPWFQRDPLLDPLRRLPEFRDLLGSLERTWNLARDRHTR